MTFDARSRFLPPGFPLPDPETLEVLRRNIRERTATPFPPEAAELAAIIAADEAGIDLEGVDANEVWLMAPDEREPVFEAIGRLLGELAG